MRPSKSASIPCAHCSTPFRPSRRWQKFCSVPCRNDHHNAQKSRYSIWMSVVAEIEAGLNASPPTLATMAFEPHDIRRMKEYGEEVLRKELPEG